MKNLKKGHLSDAKKSVLIQQPPTIDTPQLSDGELGKIQEILLGKQLRTSSEQMDSLRSWFSQQIAQLNEQHSQQVADLGRKLEDAQSDFTNRLEQQEKKHQAKLGQVSSSLTASLSTVTANLSTITTNLGKTESALAGRVTDLTESLTSTRDDLTAQIEKTTRDLQSRKIDRDSVSSLFGRLATELADHSDLVSKESANAANHSD